VQEYVYNKLKFRSGFNPTGLMQMTLVHKFCCSWKLGASFCGSINLAWSFISLLCQFSSELHFMAYFNLTDLHGCVLVVVWELSYGWYFTFVQGLVYLGVISCYGFRAKHILNPWRTYCKLSAVLISHGLTKGSLMFPNYPAQIMFKSTRLFNLESLSVSSLYIFVLY
jgi:hypothetical protein